MMAGSMRAGALSAHRSGHHRAGERRGTGAARTPGELAAAALLHHRRLRRTRRESRGRGRARGGGRDRRGRDGPALRLLAAMAVPLVADDRLSGLGGRRQQRAGERRAGGGALVHARADPFGRGAGAALAVHFLAPDRDLAERTRLEACVCWCSHGKPFPATAWWWPPTAMNITSVRPRRWRSGRRRRL